MSPIAFLVRPPRALGDAQIPRDVLPRPTSRSSFGASRIDDADLAGLDLSALRFVVNGAASRSRPQTLRKFTDRFAKSA